MELEYHSVIVMDQHLHLVIRRVDNHVIYRVQEIILEIVLTHIQNVMDLICVGMNNAAIEWLIGWLTGMLLLLLVTGVIVSYV